MIPSFVAVGQGALSPQNVANSARKMPHAGERGGVSGASGSFLVRPSIV